MFRVKEHAMQTDFEDLTRQVLQTALDSLENLDEAPDGDVVTLVIQRALDIKIHAVDKIDGDWTMHMMWQVPDLLAKHRVCRRHGRQQGDLGRRSPSDHRLH